jgi:hypothetical protein
MNVISGTVGENLSVMVAPRRRRQAARNGPESLLFGPPRVAAPMAFVRSGATLRPLPNGFPNGGAAWRWCG